MTNGRAKIDYDALVKEDRVHGRVYTDPEIFEEELNKIFYRGWVYIGHASEIPRPGDFRLTTIGRQQRTFAGRTIHKLRPEGNSFKIAYKKVMLVNNDEEMPALVFLI